VQEQSVTSPKLAQRKVDEEFGKNGKLEKDLILREINKIAEEMEKVLRLR